MTHEQVRERFLQFFKNRGHAILPSASLVPENDPTVLFNTAGMQPLVPYLMGEPHPQGTRLADVQKCVRTGDIDDIGDKTHATFFEMLGNWSLGDYFKEDAIRWSYEFLFSKEEGLGLDPARLYVTVFEGDENAPKDTEAAEIWKKVGIPEHRIYYKGADSNWWPAVKGKDSWTGPTGPCTEMFYDITPEGLGDLTKEQYIAADDAQKVVEIWNDVFMAFEKKDGKIVRELAKRNVDTGAGYERLLAVIQKKDSIFDTDLFAEMMRVAGMLADNVRSQRIIADHLRSATFLIADGVVPANADQGYILRRLIRRAVFNAKDKTISWAQIAEFVKAVISTYEKSYPTLKTQNNLILQEIAREEERFRKTVAQGFKELQKISVGAFEESVNGVMTKSGANSIPTAKDLFVLYSTHGLNPELALEELIRMKKQLTEGGAADLSEEIEEIKRLTPELLEGFHQEMKKHQDLSRAGAEQKFKGGLADTSEMSVKYHTATHLLHQALRSVLGTHVEQKGSNINPERLRFDFVHPQKMTDDEKKKVEDMVNDAIKRALPVKKVTLPFADAEKTGALHFFGEKYGDTVNVYYIGDTVADAFSKEFCGGPHVENTSVLGTFKIAKEEAVSAGVRRIKAVLQ